MSNPKPEPTEPPPVSEADYEKARELVELQTSFFMGN
jgi:hypothetical protein